MKKFFIAMVALFIAVPMVAQTWGYIRDEDGYTNIRSGPGTNYSIIQKRRDGSEILYSRGKGNWYRVYADYGEPIGYIHASKVVSSRRSAPQPRVHKRWGIVVREGGYTNVRSGPGTRYSIVKKVRDGSDILFSGRPGDSWYRVYDRNGDYMGYMSANKIIWNE